MVRLTIPHISQPIVEIVDDSGKKQLGILTRPWQRFFSQMYQRTGEEDDKVAAGVNVADLKATASSTAPSGWLICNGAAKSRTTFSSLFVAIGTTYGVGDGSTTFNIPDGVGRVLIGAGTGAGLTARTRGDEDGEETHLTDITEMPNHGHSLNNAGVLVDSAAGSEYVTTAGNKGNIVAVTTDNVGSDAPHNNMQPFFVANWIIKT